MDQESKERNKNILRGAVVIGGASVISSAVGFFSTMAIAKRQDPVGFAKGIEGLKLSETGTSLAMRALTRATLFSFGGFAVTTVLVALAMGVRSPKEFSRSVYESMGKAKPVESVRSSEPEIHTLDDLVRYVTRPSQPKSE